MPTLRDNGHQNVAFFLVESAGIVGVAIVDLSLAVSGRGAGRRHDGAAPRSPPFDGERVHFLTQKTHLCRGVLACMSVCGAMEAPRKRTPRRWVLL